MIIKLVVSNTRIINEYINVFIQGLYLEVSGAALQDLMYRTNSDYDDISLALSLRGYGQVIGAIGMTKPIINCSKLYFQKNIDLPRPTYYPGLMTGIWASLWLDFASFSIFYPISSLLSCKCCLFVIFHKISLRLKNDLIAL